MVQKFSGENPTNCPAFFRCPRCHADCCDNEAKQEHEQPLLAAVREAIARYCEAESPVSDEVVDESYFVAHRAKGSPRRRERGKAIVFGLFKRNGRVHTETVPDCSKPTLQGIIRGCWHFNVLFIQMFGVATVVW